MKKILYSSILSMICLSASAQSAYEAGNVAQSDLIGTARYVGMGGALNALGADVTLMSSNPAGTGLYRRSDVNVSMSGLVTGKKGQLSNDRSRASLDQAGVLFAVKVDNSGSGVQYVNFGVNYKKNRNFFGNNILNVNHLNNQLSQTFQIADLANNSAYYDHWDVLADVATGGHDCILHLNESTDRYEGIAAQDANYYRATYGSNIEADINLSFNVSDQFYYGVSLGLYNFDYNRDSFYEELGVDGFYYDFSNWYRLIGTGVDLKFGFICRPIQESPFRFGIAIHTPTWYKLVEANGTTLYMNDDYLMDRDSGDFEYKLRTPWRFNFSLAHTIGKKLAVGAEYELADLTYSKYSSVDFSYRNYLNGINREGIKTTLKTQHTLKLGAEYKPVSAWSLRLGYNFIASTYDKDAYRTILYDEPFTETDYTNWGAINRITCGAGYSWKSGYIDLAYQLQLQNGDFYAFDNTHLKPTTITNNRSQIMATLGFRF